MTEPYRPIPCETHAEYELAIMHRTRLAMRWRDATGAEHHARVLPLDTEATADKEEYLVVERENGQRERIRLDRILEANPA
ncbi:MAG: Rho-binding antiterminator [Thiohalomonadaceae bacterium]